MIRPNLSLLLAPAILAGATLLSGCSSDPTKQGDAVADSGSTSIGSYIPRKKSAGAGPVNTSTADLQQLENARNNSNGVLNLPQK